MNEHIAHDTMCIITYPCHIFISVDLSVNEASCRCMIWINSWIVVGPRELSSDISQNVWSTKSYLNKQYDNIVKFIINAVAADWLARCPRVLESLQAHNMYVQAVGGLGINYPEWKRGGVHFCWMRSRESALSGGALLLFCCYCCEFRT